MSPKNKGKFGKGKSAVELEDEFVSTMSKIGAQLKPHAVKITVGVAAVFLLLAAVFTYRWWDQRQEAAATEIYHQAVAISRVLVMPEPAPEPDAAREAGQEGADQGKKVALIKDEDQDGVPDSFPSEAERAKAALALLDRLRAEYGSTEVAGEAALLHASMLYQAGRYGEARDMYKQYADQGDVPALRTTAREGMAYAQEALAMTMEEEQARQAALQKVLEMFRDIQRSDEGPDRDRALYHEARILAALGKKDEAIAALRKALEIAPEGTLSYDINERLAQLESSK